MYNTYSDSKNWYNDWHILIVLLITPQPLYLHTNTKYYRQKAENLSFLARYYIYKSAIILHSNAIRYY